MSTYKKTSVVDMNRLSFKTYLFQLFIIYIVFKPFIKLFYKVKIEGRQNIPQDRKFICSANHISYFDPILVTWAVRKPISFMAKKDLYTNKFFEWIFPKLGSFSVNQQKLEVSTVKSVKTVINSGKWLLGIFPQGGIFDTKKLDVVQRGFVVMAKMFKNDILPIFITGVEQYNWKPFNKGNINIKIGTPVSFELEDEIIIEEWKNQLCSLSDGTYEK